MDDERLMAKVFHNRNAAMNAVNTALLNVLLERVPLSVRYEAAALAVDHVQAWADEGDKDEHSCRWCPHAKTGEGLG